MEMIDVFVAFCRRSFRLCLFMKDFNQVHCILQSLCLHFQPTSVSMFILDAKTVPTSLTFCLFVGLLQKVIFLRRFNECTSDEFISSLMDCVTFWRFFVCFHRNVSINIVYTSSKWSPTMSIFISICDR